MEQNQRLRLEALKAQINPHFLYNTFGSVIYLVEEGKKEEAIEMLVALSELLHISLSRSQELITVEQELGLLRRYMDIQKVRYENRFRYLIDVDIDIMKLYMVKIVLQPVVENVLEHGLKQKADIQALICIRGWREKELLIFEVSDNCNTLTFQRMEEVNRKIHGTEPARAAKTGIGLKNVNDRICYEFSNDKRLGVWMAKREKETVTRIVLKVEEGLDDGTI
jgi:two-component system sensor histidine kinase YesM